MAQWLWEKKNRDQAWGVTNVSSVDSISADISIGSSLLRNAKSGSAAYSANKRVLIASVVTFLCKNFCLCNSKRYRRGMMMIMLIVV